MKLIPLTQGKFAMVDDEDYEWLNQWKWCAQNCNGIYAARGVVVNGKKRNIRMQNVINPPPNGFMNYPKKDSVCHQCGKKYSKIITLRERGKHSYSDDYCSINCYIEFILKVD